MRILILGGSKFVGRHIAVQALKRGHHVTLFNRGIEVGPDTQHEWFNGDIEHICGDRDADMRLLANRPWDTVIDCCGYFPHQIIESAKALSANCQHYIFISSISAYTPLSRKNLDETHPVAQLHDKSVDTITEQTYGPLKGQCETELQNHFSGKITIVRPGFIVGRWDPSDRFNLWLRKLSTERELTVPEDLTAPFQIIDVRDLTAWIIRLAENSVTGSFNAVGPEEPLSWGEWLRRARYHLGSKTKLIPTSETTLRQAGLSVSQQWPLWVPNDLRMPGHHHVCNKKAMSTGLEFRPLELTISGTD